MNSAGDAAVLRFTIQIEKLRKDRGIPGDITSETIFNLITSPKFIDDEEAVTDALIALGARPGPAATLGTLLHNQIRSASFLPLADSRKTADAVVGYLDLTVGRQTALVEVADVLDSRMYLLLVNSGFVVMLTRPYYERRRKYKVKIYYGALNRDLMEREDRSELEIQAELGVDRDWET